jgi:hypothetical protein
MTGNERPGVNVDTYTARQRAPSRAASRTSRAWSASHSPLATTGDAPGVSRADEIGTLTRRQHYVLRRANVKQTGGAASGTAPSVAASGLRHGPGGE